MADPVSWIAIGSAAASSIAGAVGASQQAGARSNMFSYQAGLAQQRKQIAEQNRDYSLYTGETQSMQYGIKAREQMGAIRAAQGASNIDIGSGSAADVQASQRTVAGMDVGMIRSNAARRAYGYSIEAAQEGASADMYQRASRDATKAGKLGVASSLIGGVSSVASKWLTGRSQGLYNFGSPGGSGDSDPTYSNYGFGNA